MIKGTPIWNTTGTTDGKTTRMELTGLIRFRNAWYCGPHEGDGDFAGDGRDPVQEHA